MRKTAAMKVVKGKVGSAVDLGSDDLASRVGARRVSEIPPTVLAALNAGRVETKNLVEYLGMDAAAILQRAAGVVGLSSARRHVLARPAVTAAIAAAPSAIKRFEVAYNYLLEALQVPSGSAGHKGKGANANKKNVNNKSSSRTSTDNIPEGLAKTATVAAAALAAEPSDVLRSWGCALAGRAAWEGGAHLPLPQRVDHCFDAIRPFAADAHMAVRECAWSVLRPVIIDRWDEALPRLSAWARDEDFRVRRCAVEGSRPRGVWCAHFPLLKANPAHGLSILDPCAADPERYVQNAVANWVNDASKSDPEWARAVCAQWSKQHAGSPHTAYIVKRALRTVEKTTERRAKRPRE